MYLKEIVKANNVESKNSQQAVERVTFVAMLSLSYHQVKHNSVTHLFRNVVKTLLLQLICK